MSETTHANQRHYDTHPHPHEHGDSRSAENLARRLAHVFLRAYPFDEDTTTVIDYACGSGLISRELAAHARTIIGVDISPHTVARYNERVEQQGIASDEMRAVTIQDISESEITPADVVVCASAFHHFDDIRSTTRALFALLKPGGTLLVADLLHSAGAEALFPAHEIVAHRGGLVERDVVGAFDAAGFREVSLEVAAKAYKQGHPVEFFLAKGVKPVDGTV